MRAPIRFAVLALVLISSRSNAADLLSSCVGRFCMFKPLTEKQFVALYGEGVLRPDAHDQELRSRCFYDDTSKQWAEFEFSRHSERGPRHLEGVALGQTELCSSHYRSRRPMNLRIAKGAVTIGMNEKDVIEKLGRPSKVVTLKPNAPNDIYDSQWGTHAWIYDSSESELLFRAIYVKDGKMVNYRIFHSE